VCNRRYLIFLTTRKIEIYVGLKSIKFEFTSLLDVSSSASDAHSSLGSGKFG
jgi:hypothetical protein